ncbi:hypothetical protein BC828DRAFT_382859 [Blastocladiella britannica]|nr:hypothetical protein BC828DRAFT_382859 [Blastocladiella britannica]
MAAVQQYKRPMGLLGALVLVMLVLAGSTSALAVDTTQGPFAGHQVVRVYGDARASPLRDFMLSNHIDMWSDLAPSRTQVDLRVSPNQAAQLQALGMRSEVLIPDLAAIYAASTEPAPLSSAAAPSHRQLQDTGALGSLRISAAIDSSYLSYDKVKAYLSNLAAAAAPGTVTLESVGKTYEGRDIPAVRISRPKSLATIAKMAVITLGGVHAREWVGPAAVLAGIHDLATAASTDPTTASSPLSTLLDAFDFVFVPVANPDGYVFTFGDPANRLWRKNRQPTKAKNLACIGIDINRNFPTNWAPAAARNASNPDSECAETYPGDSAAQALEVQSLTAYMTKLATTIGIAAVYDLHAYSQLFMYPYGSTCATRAPNAAAMQAAAASGVASMPSGGSGWQVGQICQTIYEAAGSSVDWAYGGASGVHTPFAFAVEMSPAQADVKVGFLVPPAGLATVVKETMAGWTTSLQSIRTAFSTGTVVQLDGTKWSAETMAKAAPAGTSNASGLVGSSAASTQRALWSGGLCIAVAILGAVF